MSTFTVQSSSLYAVADEIRAKGGTSDMLSFPDGFISAIAAIDGGGGGGGEVGKGNVRFVDFDGTIIKKWSIDDVNMASELPTNPTHDGLTSQGWNWTLSDIQAYMSSYPQATLTVGQMYTTSDGSTRIYVEFPEDTPNNRMTFPLVFGASDGYSAQIDWGDGDISTSESTGLQAYEHTYMQPGEYVITISTNGSIYFGGSEIESDTTSCIFGARDTAHLYNANRVKRIELGANVNSIEGHAFAGCCSLRAITLPDTAYSVGAEALDGCSALAALILPANVNGVPRGLCKGCVSLRAVSIPHGSASISESAFSGCTSLDSVAVPPGVTMIEQYSFESCQALASATIPDGISSIGECAFQGCVTLAAVTVPSGVSTIGSMAFEACGSIGAYRVKAYTPPALQSASDITVPNDCIIYVPGGCMSDYASAYGWEDYSGQMQEDWG